MARLSSLQYELAVELGRAGHCVQVFLCVCRVGGGRRPGVGYSVLGRRWLRGGSGRIFFQVPGQVPYFLLNPPQHQEPVYL